MADEMPKSHRTLLVAPTPNPEFFGGEWVIYYGNIERGAHSSGYDTKSEAIEGARRVVDRKTLPGFVVATAGWEVQYYEANDEYWEGIRWMSKLVKKPSGYMQRKAAKLLPDHVKPTNVDEEVLY